MVMTWLWQSDQLIEMWHAANVLYPQSINAVEESPGVLLLYDYFRGSGQRLLFNQNGVAEIHGIVDGGLVAARRVGETRR